MTKQAMCPYQQHGSVLIAGSDKNCFDTNIKVAEQEKQKAAGMRIYGFFQFMFTDVDKTL